jgi:hypothetical protein
MKRYLLLLALSSAAVATVFPGVAGAATFRGVVIAKDSARQALVTASADGSVRTVRLHTGFRRIGIGARVIVRGPELPDGTFSAAALKRSGKSRQAHVHATIVKRLGARLALAAGGSVFALRVSGKAGASAGGDGSFGPGDRIDGKTRIRGGGLESAAGDLTKVGHDDQLALEGIYLAIDDEGAIELAVVHRGRVFVPNPDGVDVPEFKAGDEIALVVTVESDGSFTLVKAENENEAGDGDGDDDGDIDLGKEEFTVAGILATAGQSGVAVRVEGRTEPLRCKVPYQFNLEGFQPGQRVAMTCKYREGHFVLVALKAKDAPPPPGDYIGVAGTISSLYSGAVSVEVEGHTDPVSCLVPAGMDVLGFTEGDEVKLYCVKTDGHYVVKALISDHASITPDGSWFMVAGVISELNAERISLDVDGRDSPVTCAVVAGADLSGFAVDDQVTMKCKVIGAGFKLKLLESDTARYELVG